MKRLTLFSVTALLACSSIAFGRATALPKHGTTVMERTANGFAIAVAVSRDGKSGRMSLRCPNGKSLGRTPGFPIRGGAFTAVRLAGQKRVFRFAGHFGTPTQVTGFGSIALNACGNGQPSGFSQPAIGMPHMTNCPQTDPEHPFAAGTAFTFKGVLPGASQGTHLRIEYTNPDGTTAVAHVVTDLAGNFADTHAFASDGGTVWGADVQPRYPDDPLLSSGKGCDLQIQ
jgi:hypothetical protein